MITDQDIKYMLQAMELAKETSGNGEVPVGAVIVLENEIIASGKNQKENFFNPVGHAEIIAIKNAAENIKNWRLENCSLYVTLEPCPMCLGAMIQARIKRLVFGAYDKKGGAISLGYNLYKDNRLNHNFDIVGGILMEEASCLLSNFFSSKRKK